MLAVGGAAFMGGLLGTLYALQLGGARTGLVAPCTTPGGGGGLPVDEEREPSSGQHHQQAGGNTHPPASSSSEAGVASEVRDAAIVSPSHSAGGASVGPRGGSARAAGRGGAALAAGRGFNVDARMRVQWQEITAMCNRRNYTSCREVDRSGWTDAARSTFSELEFAGLGAWSTFKVCG